jgi:hypothetical protein
MPHLPTKLFAATLVFGFAVAIGQAKAAPLPVQSALATEAGASHALPVEKVHRRYPTGAGVLAIATIIGDRAIITALITTATGPIIGTDLATATGGNL